MRTKNLIPTCMCWFQLRREKAPQAIDKIACYYYINDTIILL